MTFADLGVPINTDSIMAIYVVMFMLMLMRGKGNDRR